MTVQADLLAEVESFLEQSGMAPGTLGNYAVNDGKFVPRLRAGMPKLTIATVEKVRSYIAEQRAALGLPDAAQVAAAERRATRKQRAARVPDWALPLPPTPPARRKRGTG